MKGGMRQNTKRLKDGLSKCNHKGFTKNIREVAYRVNVLTPTVFVPMK
jgi:hypothetical protein